MHPALRPTRTQRTIARATDTIGGAFWILMALILLAAITGLLAGF